jgi:putative ABC transport system permease protein
MLRNYLTVAFRNLLKHRLYSFINIGGLAVGLAACLLILLFVRDELSYDRWLPNADRIAVAETVFKVPGRETMAFAGAPGLLRAALLKDFSSEVAQVVRVFSVKAPVRIGDRQFLTSINYVDPNFFDVFDLSVVAGDRKAAVADTHSIVISERLSKVYFGDSPAVGKTMTISGKRDYTVVAVLADLPGNTHLDLDAVARYEAELVYSDPKDAENWTSANSLSYVQFTSPEAMQRVRSGTRAFVDRNVHFDVPGFDKEKPSSLMEFEWRPLLEIHLHGTRSGYPKPNGDFAAVVAFSAIAALILIIACINFVNLATARAMQRAREVAMRKVLGATRWQLIRQHLGEALLTALLALVLAFALVELTLPLFNGFVHKDLALRFSDPRLMLTAMGLIGVVGVVGGLYPAVYLSRFLPARVLRANPIVSLGSVDDSQRARGLSVRDLDRLDRVHRDGVRADRVRAHRRPGVRPA